MRRVVLCTCLGILAAALIPASALAKGASEATIAGPGLAKPIQLRAVGGSETAGPLADIAQAAGFFPGVFGQEPDPIALERPDGPLGPRYTITYVMPGPDNERSTLVQDVYPYAEPYPVTYTEPGQRFWTTERTHGGWFVARWEPLKDDLVAAGLPATPPAVGGGDGGGFPWIGGAVAALATLVGAAVLAAFLVRRRPDPAAA
jgi:hypothetical protein